ncbi:50S ribosomal protein L6 [candidate division TM6 bacterium RIFCSPHIGHO2_12_FULL_36_22]|nr:MAG: 50S ribosomal protein L6 [candidate division TM6 bacterium RIFCSPHIGHO2_12_FULL_36_22]
MSKIGRKPIKIGDVTVDVKGQDIHFKGKEASGVYTLPEYIKIDKQDKVITLGLEDSNKKSFWGLHRALLSNVLSGAEKQFEKKLIINGLGYKAQVQGSSVVLTLGFSHKIDYVLPEGVSMEVDKSGQRLTLRSANKQQLGQACASIRAFRPPEPYKGTGIKLENEIIARKAGKAKGA